MPGAIYEEVPAMPNNKHLTLDNRTTIETMLDLQASFKEIAAALDKDPSTISKMVASVPRTP